MAERGLRSCSVWTWLLLMSVPWHMKRSLNQTPPCLAGMYWTAHSVHKPFNIPVHNITAQTCPPLCRITSIDVKYQIWKFGVVFTDNVSYGRSIWYNLKKKRMRLEYSVTDGPLSSFRLSCTWCGTFWCLSLDITTTSSLPLIFWTSPWVSKPCAPSCLLSLTMANRCSQCCYTGASWGQKVSVY